MAGPIPGSVCNCSEVAWLMLTFLFAASGVFVFDTEEFDAGSGWLGGKVSGLRQGMSPRATKATSLETDRNMRLIDLSTSLSGFQQLPTLSKRHKIKPPALFSEGAGRTSARGSRRGY
jgi:hypothetical protein